MEASQLNWITNFIWGIADDVLRDLYVRGKYRDVILPMTVIRRLDAVLEPTKQAVLDMKASLDEAGIVNQDAALRQAAGQAFYNTSKFTLRDLRARGSRQQLEADFRDYLDGFSPNVQEIIDNFEFRNQIPRLAKADALGTLIEKFLDPSINLSPYPVLDSDGSVRLPGLESRSPERWVLTRGEAPQGWQALPSPAALGQAMPQAQYLLVEGGAGAAAAFLAADCVDRLAIYRAPIIIGGGQPGVADIGLATLPEAHGRWALSDSRQLGKDRLEVYERLPCSPE